MSRSKRSLRNVFVIKGTQLRIVIWISIFLVAMALSQILLLVLVLKQIMPADLWQSISSRMDYLIPFGVGSAIYVVCGTFYALVISHRLAGPVYKVIQTMRRVGEGESGVRLQFRPNDEFHELAHGFNEMMNRIEKGK